MEKNPEKKRKETAYEFGIKPSTLSGILRGKEKYKFQYYSGQTDVQKMRARPPKQEAVDIRTPTLVRFCQVKQHTGEWICNEIESRGTLSASWNRRLEVQ